MHPFAAIAFEQADSHRAEPIGQNEMSDGNRRETTTPGQRSQSELGLIQDHTWASPCDPFQRKAFVQPALSMLGSIKLFTQGRAGSGDDAMSMQMMMM
jgi:hypothetical protein